MTTCRNRVVVAGLLGMGLCIGQVAHAQLTWADVLGFKAPAEAPVYADSLQSKAAADECFNGIGVDYPPINPDGSCDLGIPKHNLAYVWGLTQAGLGDSSFTGDGIWFGTIANPLCEGAAGIFDPDPKQTVSWVCEYGESELARRPRRPLPPAAGDWRLPRAYSYDVRTGHLTDRTPIDPSFRTLAGIRSAGALGNAVLMAGPSFQHDVTFAAWNAATGSYRGSCRATALNNIRQWIAVNGVLYAAAGRDAGDGVILRWRGTADDPFVGAGTVAEYCGFEVVGTMPGFPAYIASYGGERLAVSVWSKNRRPPEGGKGSVRPFNFAAGVYLGPPFGTDGEYSTADANRPWLRIWSPAEYETDPVVASTIGGGAITFWRGYLWFGTIHNTSGTMQAHTTCTLSICYGKPANADEQINLLFNVSRAVSIWRARLDESGRPEVELLYGETSLPALVPGTKTFEARSTGWAPKYGRSGFDNPFLTYAWSALAGSNDLLFGLYDYRYVFDVRLGILTESSYRAGQMFRTERKARSRQALDVDVTRGYGADLWRFDDVDTPGKAESVHGLGNFTNYGVRTMLRFDDGPNVMLGTASGLNLEPMSGWELHWLQAPAP